MKDKRIYSDIPVKIKPKVNGEFVNPAQIPGLKVELKDRTGRKFYPILAVDNEKIYFTFYGIDHGSLGAYRITIYANFNERGQRIKDFENAFNLVDSTAKIKQYDDDHEGLEVEDVLEFEADMVLGVKGDSAYQSWLNDGYTGTNSDFVKWIQKPALDAAKKAEDAAKEAENVNARLEGDTLMVTDRNGNTTLRNVKGDKGDDGKTPVKGVDYFDGKDGEDYVITEKDYEEIAKKVEVSGGGSSNQVIDSLNSTSKESALSANQGYQLKQMLDGKQPTISDANKLPYSLLSGVPNIPSLDGYATQSWVTSQNYLTKHQDITGKADRAVVVSNSNAAVSVNVGSYTKDTIIKCGTITSLALTNVTDNAVEVSVIFSVGNSAENILSIPSGTKVVGEINIEGKKTYALSILCGAVVCGTINLSE